MKTNKSLRHLLMATVNVTMYKPLSEGAKEIQQKEKDNELRQNK